MIRANEYTVKRIGEDVFELWHDNRRLATLTKKEAWPVMMGQVHPDSIVRDKTDEAAVIQERSDDE